MIKSCPTNCDCRWPTGEWTPHLLPLIGSQSNIANHILQIKTAAPPYARRADTKLHEDAGVVRRQARGLLRRVGRDVELAAARHEADRQADGERGHRRLPHVRLHAQSRVEHERAAAIGSMAKTTRTSGC